MGIIFLWEAGLDYTLCLSFFPSDGPLQPCLPPSLSRACLPDLHKLPKKVVLLKIQLPEGSTGQDTARGGLTAPWPAGHGFGGEFGDGFRDGILQEHPPGGAV